MGDMVSVPAEKIAALREAQKDRDGGKHGVLPVLIAARAVVDAVETEDEPDCGHTFINYCVICNPSREPDPAVSLAAPLARDDAEHMAAPDELTALRRDLAAANARAEKMESFEDALALPKLLAETAAERDALREQLTALRVAVIELATKHGIEPDDLYATLGAGDA